MQRILEVKRNDACLWKYYELILLVGGYKYLKRSETCWKFVNLRNFRNFK